MRVLMVAMLAICMIALIAVGLSPPTNGDALKFYVMNSDPGGKELNVKATAAAMISEENPTATEIGERATLISTSTSDVADSQESTCVTSGSREVCRVDLNIGGHSYKLRHVKAAKT